MLKTSACHTETDASLTKSSKSYKRSERSTLGEFVYVVAGGLSKWNETLSMMCVKAGTKTIHQLWVQCPVSTLHHTSVSRKDTFLTPITTTSFPSCPMERHRAIFENTQASRMAAVWLITAWRKMVNKGHGMAHADWAAIVKNVWKSCKKLLSWCCANIAFI